MPDMRIFFLKIPLWEEITIENRVTTPRIGTIDVIPGMSGSISVTGWVARIKASPRYGLVRIRRALSAATKIRSSEESQVSISDGLLFVDKSAVYFNRF